MLEDRDYMRQPEYRTPRVSWTVVLLIVNAIVFLAQQFLLNSPAGLEIQGKYFALSDEGIKAGYYWQFLTYQFMHASLLHILGNSVAIYFFGRELEVMLGARKFLTLYFSSGVVGGIVQIIAALSWPQMFGSHVVGGHLLVSQTVGASAGAFGLVAAFAMMFPDRELTMLLFYFIPIRMRARTLLIGAAALALLGVIFSRSIFGGNIAHFAHLGGMAMGIFYVRQILQGRWFHFNNPLRRKRPREAVTTHAGEKKFWRSAPAEEDVSADEFVQSKVDPILEKISAHGIQSLTAREREILESARKKMTRP